MTIEQINKFNDYKVSSIFINNKNINDFIEPKWHRQYRITQINKLKNTILKGFTFGEVITLNKVEEKFRVINGNHRIFALRDLILAGNEINVKTTIHTYEDLTEDEEKEIYGKINAGVKETRSDKLKAYLSKIRIYQDISDNFPCRVCIYNISRSSINSINLSTLLESYILRKEANFNWLDLDNFIEECKKLGKEDYSILDEMIKVFIEIFGEPNYYNPFSKSTFFSVYLKFYYSEIEKNKINKVIFVERFKKIKNRYLSELEQLSKSGGRSAKLSLYNYTLTILNKGEKYKFEEIIK